MLPVVNAVFAAILLAAGLAFASPADADSNLLARTLSVEDAGRLAQFEEVRETAISVARKEGARAEQSRLNAILAGDPQPILGIDIRGQYRCRYAKLDGILPLIVYGWFDCVIGEDDIGYRLEKMTGSQRLAGHFVDIDPAYLVFFGAEHYAGESPLAYGADAGRNLVGRFVKVGEKRYRLEIPQPPTEARFNILELRG